MILRPLLIACLMLPLACAAQSDAGSGPKRKAPAHRHSLTANFPGIVVCTEYTGISIGAEYRGVFNRAGTLSASLGVTKLIWAGTQETGEDYRNGYRANIAASLLAPGVTYHPFSTSGYASLDIGARALIGSIRRMNHYQPYNGYHTTYTLTERAFFASPQMHLGVSLYPPGRRFMMSFYGEFGPILAADSKTVGNFGTIGMKIGSRI